MDSPRLPGEADLGDFFIAGTLPLPPIPGIACLVAMRRQGAKLDGSIIFCTVVLVSLSVLTTLVLSAWLARQPQSSLTTRILRVAFVPVKLVIIPGRLPPLRTLPADRSVGRPASRSAGRSGGPGGTGAPFDRND